MTNPSEDGPADNSPDVPLIDGPEEEKRLERLMETLLWMAWPRRPGFLGAPVALSGTLPDGRRARLSKKDDEWRYSAEGDDEQIVVDASNAPTILADKSFLPSSVVTIPEVAPHVYLASIVETEAAHQAWLEAARATIEAVPDAGKFFRHDSFIDSLIMNSQPMPFVLATGAMDECVRRSVTAIPLAVAAADAQVNTWANSFGGWSKKEQSKPWTRRVEMLAERHAVSVDIDGEALSTFRQQMRLRNDLIHGNAIAVEEPLERRGGGRPLVLEARRTCLAVRIALLHLAEIFHEEPPRYLSFCPEGPIEDDEVWRNARVSTGMREDSIFPKVRDRRN